ncbi:HalOD1 output domain-containing protein [Halovivax gelatinilyticus]|uniref:HalOD1 output domain-containing protein n=1 Tax=Halovivax gelatinilyticus TaxID=2961597 RepID=UPI0020CA97FB|nr:HalOD1 output domain-containing protein [Halovivax gelatinilyticus]
MNAIDSNTPARTGDPTQTTTIKHDWSDDQSLALSIVDAIADLTGTDPIDVPSLYERIDPDSLDSLFNPTKQAGNRNVGHVWIPVDDYGVTIYGDGTIFIRKLE